MQDDALLAELVRLSAAEKTAAAAPTWVIDARADGLARVRTAVPLAIDGTTVYGLRLEINGPHVVRRDAPLEGLTALLFATIRAKDYHLGRLEFGAEVAHRNSVQAPDLEQFIKGPHFHGGVRNAVLGLRALRPDANLPIAVPIDRAPATFAGALDEISVRFNIAGLWFEEGPPWSITMI